MYSIAIDGPAGAGKSTLARRLAKELGYIYVDTGAMYRAIGLYALRAGVDPADAARVEGLLPRIALRLENPAGAQRIYLNGEDVSEAIRAEQVGMAASAVAAHPVVRAFLLDLQRGMARTQNVLMDGRDIGTVILPDASVKIFLTASPEARARRRWLELQERGQETDFETVLRDVLERDDRDTHRAAAPLRQAEDAVLLDNSDFTFQQSVERLVGLVREHAGRYPHEFSGGQRQRISIARTLALDPKFIVCDEPISALDVSIQAQIINLLIKLQKERDLTMLFIAHDLLVVHHISDRIAVMYLGKMMELADSDELNDNPIHPYTQSLLSAVPIPDPKTARQAQRIVLEGDVPSPLHMPSGCPFRTRCRYATEQCAKEMPPFTDRGNGHYVACWNK